jgi:cell division protein FtsW (lipid II flippase)
MKSLINRSWIFISTMVLFCCVSILTFAQDKGADIDISVKKESEWYQNPIVWVIGGAVFILLLVALLRGGEKRSA